MTDPDGSKIAAPSVPSRRWDGEIARLSTAAFLALVSEPLFLLADAAIVGHLGTPQLAGLGIATAVIGTLISLSIFLAYGTTAAVARQVGAGHARRALTQGVDGLWLAGLVGAVASILGVPLAGRIVGLFGPDASVSGYATTYLRIALLGAIPMLVVLAATGVLRGLKDLRTPLVVAVAGNLGNIGLNLLLVYGVGLGIAGSALGSLLAQLGMALALVVVLLGSVRRTGAGVRPDLPGIRRAAAAGVPLIVRTLLLRAVLLIMTYGATALSSADLAAMQLALTIWSFLAFALDAVAIAAQTMVGNLLGRGAAADARRLTRRLLGWGVLFGVVTGLVLLVCGTVLGPLFTDDPAVRDLLVPVLLVAALAQPVAGIVFVLDGVLIGAGDNTFLAWCQAIVLALYAPAAWWAVGHGLTALWVAFAVAFMGGRAIVLLARLRSEAWLRTGA